MPGIAPGLRFLQLLHCLLQNPQRLGLGKPVARIKRFAQCLGRNLNLRIRHFCGFEPPGELQGIERQG